MLVFLKCMLNAHSLCADVMTEVNVVLLQFLFLDIYILTF